MGVSGVSGVSSVLGVHGYFFIQAKGKDGKSMAHLWDFNKNCGHGKSHFWRKMGVV